MKITELMIGDFVRIRGSIYNTKVTEILNYGINPDWCGPEVNDVIYFEDLEPIPLTDEILEKNGFKEPPHQQPTGYYLQKIEKGLECWDMVIHLHPDSLYQVTIEHSEDDVVGGLIYAQKIHHVHQLQHVLRICGLSELADNFKLGKGGTE